MKEKINNFLATLKTSNILIVVLVCLVVVLCMSIFVTRQSEVFNDSSVFTYEVYISELEDECSKSKLNEYQYKDCMYRLVESKEDEVGILYRNLSNDIKSREDLFSSLNDLYETWNLYHNALCWSKSVGDSAGENSWYPLVTCELYQTKLFSELLSNLREKWVQN